MISKNNKIVSCTKLINNELLLQGPYRKKRIDWRLLDLDALMLKELMTKFYMERNSTS